MKSNPLRFAQCLPSCLPLRSSQARTSYNQPLTFPQTSLRFGPRQNFSFSIKNEKFSSNILSEMMNMGVPKGLKPYA